MFMRLLSEWAELSPGIQLAVFKDAGVTIRDRCGTKIRSTVELIRIFNLENGFSLLNEGQEIRALTVHSAVFNEGKVEVVHQVNDLLIIVFHSDR